LSLMCDAQIKKIQVGSIGSLYVHKAVRL